MRGSSPADRRSAAPRREYPDAVRVGIGVIVWRGDKVLLVRRARPPRQGQWSIPGGGQEVGETLFEAAIREVREETGIRIEPTGIVTAVDSITPDAAGGTQFHYTLVEVAAEWLAGEPVAADDVDACRWAALDEIDALVEWAETRRVIRLAAAQRPGPAMRLRRRPDMTRLMRSPLGALIARPWLDNVTLKLLQDWLFPMSRAWAAAQTAGGDLDAFCAELSIDRPRKIVGSARLLRSLADVHAAAERVRRTAATWQDTLFDRDGHVELGDAVAAEEQRLDAAHALAMLRLRFALFARTQRVGVCRWAVPTPDEVEARHGARLADPALAYAMPETLPIVEESRHLLSSLGVEYWLRFASPDPVIGTPCWARVFEPAGPVNPPTVIQLHGIGMETDHVRVPLTDVEVLVRQGIRVITPEAPWHGRRVSPGRYSGEEFVARTPGSALDHFAAHVRELGVLTAWARRTSSGPVGWSGMSLGAFTAQLAAVHAAGWPATMRADALLLFTTSEGMEEIAINGAFARALGVDRALARAGWTAEALQRWRPLTDPVGQPIMEAENIFMVLGSEDTIAPFRNGLGIARRWGVPEDRIHIRQQGHFSVPAGLVVDAAPIAAFARHLKTL